MKGKSGTVVIDDPLAVRATAEADIIAQLQPSFRLNIAGRALVRESALGGSFMGSKVAGAFHPDSWSEGQRVLKGRITA